eukprot:1667939-Prorocentrum_lima.AAC.1
MTSSLVGSEMCIRDSLTGGGAPRIIVNGSATSYSPNPPNNTWFHMAVSIAVSYTHLTLPTICSV